MVPSRMRAAGLYFGRNRDNIRILGDIVSPMPTEWYEKAKENTATRRSGGTTGVLKQLRLPERIARSTFEAVRGIRRRNCR